MAMSALESGWTELMVKSISFLAGEEDLQVDPIEGAAEEFNYA